MKSAAEHIERSSAAWSSSEGTLPTRREDAITVIWGSCSGLPSGAKKLLDIAYEHPVAPWVLQGKPTPADPDDPLVSILPGHLDVHSGTALSEPSESSKQWMWAGCKDREGAKAAMANAPGAGHMLPYFDHCLDAPEPVTREELVDRRVSTGRVGFATYHWLVNEAKVEPAAARTLARAIILDGRWLLNAPPSLRLPHAREAPKDREGLQIYITPEGVTESIARRIDFDESGRPVQADLDDAGTYRDLHYTFESEAERQQRFVEDGEKWSGRVALAAHRTQAWDTIDPALGATTHYGFSAALVVLVDDRLDPLRVLPLHDEGSTMSAAATIDVGPDRVTIRCDGDAPEQPLTNALPACVDPEATLDVRVADDATVQHVVDALGFLGEHPRRIID